MLLKDCTLQTQSTLIKFNCKLNDEELKKLETEFNINCSIKNLKDTKTHLDNLLEYLNFAEIRFTVLEPAFFQKHDSNNEKISYSSNSETNTTATTAFDNVSNDEDIEFESMNYQSSNLDRTIKSSYSQHQYHTQNSKSIYGITHSIISCMLAPHDQLLRFCLIEDHLEKAKQIYNLFSKELFNTNEAIELFILERWHQLSMNTYEIYSADCRPISNDRNKNFELFQTNLSAFLNQNFLIDIKLKYSNIDTFSLLSDFALTTSATLEISKVLIEVADEQQAENKLNDLRSNKVVDEFIRKFSVLLNVFHNDQFSNQSLSSLIDRCLDLNIFNEPIKFKEELERKKNLVKCVTEIRNLLAIDESTIFDNFDNLLLEKSKRNSTLSNASASNLFQITTNTTNNSSTVDLKKLSIEYKKLLGLCSSKRYNYLKALFYYVQKVTKVLQEIRKRSDQYSENGKSSLDSLLKNSTSYFSVLYQSPSAILYSMVVKHRISPRYLDDLAKEMKVDLLSTLCNDLLPSIPASSKQDDLYLEFSINDCLHPALTKLVSNHLTGNNLLRQDSFLIQSHFDEDHATEMIYKYEVIQTMDLIEYFKSKSWILVKIMQLLNLIDVNVGYKDSLEHNFIENSPLIRWITIIQQIFDSDLNKKLSVDISILSLLPCLTSGNLTIIKCLEKFAQYSNWKKMYNALLIIDLNNQPNNASFNSLKTALLSKIALETGDIKYALQIRDARKRTKLMLNIIENTDLYANNKTAIEDLNSLYSTLEHDQETDQEFKDIKKMVEMAIKRVQVYTKIANLAGLRKWKDAIENLSEIDILTILKTRHTYKIVVEWNYVNQYYNEQYQQHNHLFNQQDDREIFFETDELRKELLIIAYSELKDIESINELVKNHNSPVNLFEKVLNSVDNLDCKEFIINLILERKFSEIYNNQLIGIRMIKNLNDKKRPFYMPIINEPKLIFEQMLMNMELVALEKCVKLVPIDGLNDLIEIYAKKSVDIVLIKDSVSASGSDTTMISSNYLSGSINFLANSFNQTFNSNYNQNENFVMPASIPTRNQWVCDHKVIYCMVCKTERFSMFNRRHHCRRCGSLCCSNCSQKRLLITQIHPRNPQRVCDQCYAQSTSNETTYLTSSTYSSSNSKSNQTRKESYRESTYSVVVPNRYTVEWLLTLNQQENDLIREEFYYEAAPSSSLCLSILKLHQDKKRCAQIITENLCRPLFETLSSREIDYGLVINIIKSLVNSAKVIISEEGDFNELSTKIDFLLDRIDIIKMLVDGNCLDYDLIFLLINNEQQAFQKIIEKLIEMERFELALNISTKIGTANLKNAIWKTWAIISIKHGKYLESYSKFKYCFQPKTPNEPNQHNSNLLKEIFDVFESQRVFVNLHNLKDRCKLIKQGKSNNLINVDVLLNDDQVNLLPNSLNQHAIYFLETYGCSEDYIRFYIKFKMFKQAIQLFISESQTKFDTFSSIFVNEFFLPSINNGTLDKILNQLNLIDPTLNKSWRYLISVCKYLSSNKFYSILHKIQLFMRDYIRAAMTKINYFYLNPPPTDYIQLFHRNDYLIQAKEHCRQFIVCESELNKGCLRIKKEDVLKQIHTLNLQIEITSKFYDMGVKGYLTNDNLFIDEQQKQQEQQSSNNESELNEFINSSSIKKEPLTLLTDSKTKKTYLAALVAVESSPIINDGFNLAHQIIKDNNLNLNLVYRVAAKILINSKKKNVLNLIDEFVECIKKTEQDQIRAYQYCDEFICVCIRHTNNSELIDPMIKMLNNDENKIDCYILTNKLKSAYLLAVKSERQSDIIRIMSVAESTKQDSIKSICERWLKKFNINK